jgi:hypothetical protein
MARDSSCREAAPRKSDEPRINLMAPSGPSSFHGLAEARAQLRRSVTCPGQTPSTWTRFGTKERVRG